MLGGSWARLGTVGGAVLLAVAGGVLLRAAVSDPATPPAPPSAVRPHAASPSMAGSTQKPVGRPSPSKAETGHKGVRDHITGPILPESRPVRVEIPRLRVSSSLVRLGLDSAGNMEVPADPAVAGWYGLGPTPGALGPAVIAGHVTWNRVPAVFFRLATMRQGDRVEVTRKDGTHAEFSVTHVSRFQKSSFPTRAVFGNIHYAGLRLITCGGSYDTSRHRYADNVVVFARLLRG